MHPALPLWYFGRTYREKVAYDTPNHPEISFFLDPFWVQEDPWALPKCALSFFGSLLAGHKVFLRFWINFPSQLGPQNPPKSIKNRCQDAFNFWYHFWIDFGSIFVPNFVPLDHQNIGFSLRKNKVFSKNRIPMLTSILGAILVPTLLHFGSQNVPNSTQTLNPRGINVLIDFEIDFFTMLGPSWDPIWSHVGHFFGK